MEAAPPPPSEVNNVKADQAASNARVAADEAASKARVEADQRESAQRTVQDDNREGGNADLSTGIPTSQTEIPGSEQPQVENQKPTPPKPKEIDPSAIQNKIAGLASNDRRVIDAINTGKQDEIMDAQMIAQERASRVVWGKLWEENPQQAEQFAAKDPRIKDAIERYMADKKFREGMSTGRVIPSASPDISQATDSEPKAKRVRIPRKSGARPKRIIQRTKEASDQDLQGENKNLSDEASPGAQTRAETPIAEEGNNQPEGVVNTRTQEDIEIPPLSSGMKLKDPATDQVYTVSEITNPAGADSDRTIDLKTDDGKNFSFYQESGLIDALKKGKLQIVSEQKADQPAQTEAKAISIEDRLAQNAAALVKAQEEFTWALREENKPDELKSKRDQVLKLEQELMDIEIEREKGLKLAA